MSTYLRHRVHTAYNIGKGDLITIPKMKCIICRTGVLTNEIFDSYEVIAVIMQVEIRLNSQNPLVLHVQHAQAQDDQEESGVQATFQADLEIVSLYCVILFVCVCVCARVCLFCLCVYAHLYMCI